jgi:glycosyltransferase involved in cell wall biosynthesis
VRVVHVHRMRGIGGSERHLLVLLPALERLGLEPVFVGLDDPAADPQPFYDELDAAGVRHEHVPSARHVDPGLVRRLRRTLRGLRPDLVHTHLVHADLYGALAAPAPVVSTKHNDDRFRSGLLRYLERLLTRRAARVICITEALARFNGDIVGLAADKLRVVHYGLDEAPAPWGPMGGQELPADAAVLLAVCRLVRQKGLDVALVALARVRRDHPRAHLVVLGEGTLRAELETLARTLGVADAVTFAGRVGDVAWWYRRASVVVHPVRWEGFGLALLEAMLCKRPVVASAVSSVPEIVADGETGLLVPPEDADALARAIAELLADPERAQRLGEAGRARAKREFSVARMTERTLAVYDEALASSRR